MTGEDEIPAGDVFAVTALDDGQVRLVVTTPDTELDLTLPAVSARWLAWELAKAARLEWPPPQRIVRRPT